MLQIRHNMDLKHKTTIGLGGKTPYYLSIKSARDMLEFAELESKLGIPFKILGGGSNLIIADESLCKELPFGILDIDIVEEISCRPFIADEKEILPPLVKEYLQHDHALFKEVTVSAGYKVPRLLQFCKENGLTGLEGLVGIPCRLGGTVAMNAGAYQTEVSDVLHQAEIYHKNYGIIKCSRKDMELSYRKSSFFHQGKKLENPVILSAVFIFPQTDKAIVKDKMEKNLLTKKNSQPIHARTAGCAFKNPVGENGKKVSAGLLLDKAGLKNIKVNAMQFSKIHASFLENTGDGKTKDAIELLNIAKDKVLTLFNIHLEEEVKLWK